jgi:hypothetical protein
LINNPHGYRVLARKSGLAQRCKFKRENSIKGVA